MKYVNEANLLYTIQKVEMKALVFGQCRWPLSFTVQLRLRATPATTETALNERSFSLHVAPKDKERLAFTLSFFRSTSALKEG